MRLPKPRDPRVQAALAGIDAAQGLAPALVPTATRKKTVAEFMAEARGFLHDMHCSGRPGTEVVHTWTRLLDCLVGALYLALTRDLPAAAPTTALFALGGYGRAELSPYSDLDLLILHSGTGELTALVEGLLYPLWDAGAEVQCVARTVAENLAVARTDIRSRTSLLEGRSLLGDEGLAGRFQAEVIEEEIFGAGVKPFIRAKLDEMEARHRRYGDTVYVLEPNLKEGQGGLRDIHTALWVAKTRFKVRTVRELLHRGVVPESEIRALQEAQDFLLRLRNHLHLVAGRREDRLTFESQDEAAPFFGFEDDRGIQGVEQFLQTLYRAANQVSHFARSVIRRSTAGLLPPRRSTAAGSVATRRGVRLSRGEVHLSQESVRRDPLVMLNGFEVAQAEGVELSPEALEVVRENLDRIDDRFRRDPDAVGAFFRILQSPRRVATTLMAMHDVRFLDRFIPEFARIFGRVQRDLYHTHPVDVHSLFAVQELRRLARGEYKEEFPLLSRLIRDVERPDILYLATLLHDVGKGDGYGHEERGAEIALAVGDRMGLASADLEYLVFLVRNHLILSHTAQARDLHDEELITDFARGAGDPEGLRMLYLLTFADLRAVGPGAWSSWKGLLLQELYEKALAAMTVGPPQVDRADERASAVRERLREAAVAPYGEECVERFLVGVDHPQYLLANPLETLLRHVALFAERRTPPVIHLRPDETQGFTEVVLLCRDRPGLFAHMAGLMAANRLNILSAVLNTRSDGWVLDVLHVSGPPGEGLGERQRWERWSRDVRTVLREEGAFGAVVGSRLTRKDVLRRTLPRVPTRVRVDNEGSSRFTIVDLRAADRLGLLHDVARSLAEQGLSIRLAKIATNLRMATDAFYVETSAGQKVTDAEAVRRLEAALEHVVDGAA